MNGLGELRDRDKARARLARPNPAGLIRMPAASTRREERDLPEPKRTLTQIAKREGRSLAQLCEILLAGAAADYKEEGPEYLRRLLSRLKKDASD